MTISSAPAPSLARIRAAFPALERRHRGHLVAYFDGPGGTQVPRVVVEAMEQYLLGHNANTHWPYPTSEETDALVAASRLALGDFLGASPSEIVFGANMTTLTFHLSRALGRRWGRGETIVVTELDHHANIDPWRELERERGLTVVQVPAEAGGLKWGELERALDRRPKLLAIGAASNALGTINDVRRAAELAHEANALCFVDAVHYAPHRLVDVALMDCDFLVCSAYKFYGPHLGILYGREELLRSLDVPRLAPASDTPPEMLETGTQNHEGIAGAAAAVDFLASLGDGESRRARLASAFAALQAKEQELLLRMWNGLSGIAGLTLFGPAPDASRTPTLAFTVAGYSPDAVARHLAGLGIFVSCGDFYASTLMKRLNQTNGLVRAGCACYTTAEEVDRLIEGTGSVSR